jgi:AcrR family transcriptional regulator
MWRMPRSALTRKPPARKRLTREESRARTRELVLDSALAIFRRDGFHQASIDEIAEEAGFSRGAVYSSFANKEDLFLALLDREAQRRVQLIAEGIIHTESIQDAARAAARAYYERHLADPGWSLLMTEFSAHAARNPAVAQRFREHNQWLLEAGARLIAEIFARADLALGERDASEAVTAMQAIGCGVSLEQQIDPETIAPELIEDLYVAVIERIRTRALVGARSRHS